ncbi:cwf18 pre-mRNA splicing factor-domain-containing protein [Neocallimastix lanati (nom. inval.)]|uniref:mRNA splicing factor n=1 Tax=Neocallimastix californiae TaxID=1754190 RepID=A0A1Y2ACU8_9FUNG|nr:cwf18 pre-mRNA splicing factor-domain-containing protein [Neocallimastix sp. JGI-2020a]ORY20294.1 hypothetical protein LY90DRAFT_516906 [Neocallimastix californiae]|eukprot:ORY20294.1 hypothetical protein LY90DRAFT_516906 [Neocallimastix californiae]
MEANLNTLNNAEQRKKNLQELRNRRKNKLNKRQINESEKLDDNDEIINEITVESVVEKYVKETLNKEKEKTSEINLQDLAPKKPNWDFKRDLEKKLEKLEKKTQICINEIIIIRERLKESGDIFSVPTSIEEMC